ncbi:MAG: hypothetical protein ACREGH_02125 [Minisyncoccia bacterium]
MFKKMYRYKKELISTGLGVSVMAALALMPLGASAESAYVLLSSYNPASGSTITINGHQFGSGSVSVSLDGVSTNATTTNGSFSTNLTVPSVPSGTYTLHAAGSHGEQASATLYINNTAAERHYYPTAAPSQWYVLPGQTLGFSGAGFAPNAPVSIAGGFGTLTATTSNGGTFSLSGAAVPFSWQNSRQTFTISSPGSAYPISLTVSVGTFYPNLNPSTYYVGVNQSMSASVSGFASNEQINLNVNGNSVAQTNSDGSGNASFSFSAPNSGNSFTLTAQGETSGAATSRTITLHQ